MSPANTQNIRDRVASRAIQPSDQVGQVTILDLINKQRPEVRRALPAHMDADRFTRLVITQIRQTPQLAQCSPASLLGALMVSAQLGMEPGPLGHCYLIPRQIKGVWEVQFQLGYRGIIELARRSGQLTSIYAMEVCENDTFVFEYGLNQRLEHSYDVRKPRGRPYAYYGVASFKDGSSFFLVMSLEDIEKRRGRSSAATRGPWVTDFSAMAKKTVIRAMAAYLPLSPEFVQAVAADSTVRHQELEPNMTETYLPPDDDEPLEGEIVNGNGDGNSPEPAYAPGEEPFTDAEVVDPA